MDIVINELMNIFEFTELKYFAMAVGIVFGCLILWRLCK